MSTAYAWILPLIATDSAPVSACLSDSWIRRKTRSWIESYTRVSACKDANRAGAQEETYTERPDRIVKLDIASLGGSDNVSMF